MCTPSAAARGRAIVAACLLSGSTAALAQDLPQTVAEATRLEQSDALPVTAVFATVPVAGKSTPGTLLAHESFDGYNVPRGVSAVRIVYQSLDAEGHGVTASAAVLVPPGPAPRGGWPIIAWAHGTSGVARQCAPSLMKDLYYGDEGLFGFLEAGYAVIATDYHGLGTPGPHQYVDKVAQAHDVIYSVPAARAAVPALGRKWVVDGHSQGGLAAWGTAELEAQLHDPDYLGAVSVAGALRLQPLFEHLSNTPGVAFYLAFMAYGIHARFPQFQPQQMLTPAAMQRYPAVTSSGCWYYGYAAYRDLASSAVLAPGWDANPWVQRYFQENVIGDKPVTAPLLVIAGEADTTVPIEGVRALVKASCKTGTAVSFRSYPGLDHDPTMAKSVPDQIGWIRDRFSGKPAGSSCPSH